MATQIYLIRHGETEWSLSGRHTGSTDLPLTANGERVSALLKGALQGINFSQVLVSPFQRAQKTYELADIKAPQKVDADLHEWNYGVYEGQTSAEIRAGHPGWNVFEYGGPNGESVEQVAQRADRVLSRIEAIEGTVAIFSHGQFLRALAMRWVGLPVQEGRHFAFDAAHLSILGYEHRDDDTPAILVWNASAGNIPDNKV